MHAAASHRHQTLKDTPMGWMVVLVTGHCMTRHIKSPCRMAVLSVRKGATLVAV